MAIQVKAVGFPVIRNRNVLTTNQFAARNRQPVARNLFGSPNIGEIDEEYKREERQRITEFAARYTIIKSIPSNNSTLSQRNTNVGFVPLNGTTEPDPNMSECRNSKYVRSGRITSAKCSSSIRLKSSVSKQLILTEYYNQRKKGVCNESRTSDVHSTEEANKLLSNHIQENSEVKRTNNSTSSISSASALAINESLPPATHQYEHEQSQEEISLHTMTTDQSSKLV